MKNSGKAGDGVREELDTSNFEILILGHRLKHHRLKSTIEVNNNTLLIVNDTLASLGSESVTFN